MLYRNKYFFLKLKILLIFFIFPFFIFAENVLDKTYVEKQVVSDNYKEDKVKKTDSDNIKSIFQINEHDIVLGNIDSSILLFEYYSPTCPHCAYFNKFILPELKKKYIDTNEIGYIIREFISNKQDLDASILQRCLKTQDSFLQFKAVVLNQQEKWAGSNNYRELLRNIGQIGGVSIEMYEKCLQDNDLIKVLLDNTNLIYKISGFSGTPAFFLNGNYISEGYSLDVLSKKIDQLLGSRKK